MALYRLSCHLLLTSSLSSHLEARCHQVKVVQNRNFELIFLIDNPNRSAIIVAEYASATFEVLGGFLITIISFPPFGSFKLTACYNSRVIYDDISKYMK